MLTSRPPKPTFEARVRQVADQLLTKNKSVGPLELFQGLGYVHWSHVDEWRRGNPGYSIIGNHIQLGADKFKRVLSVLDQWAAEGNLIVIDADYSRRSISGIDQLQIFPDANSPYEARFRKHYARGDLSDKRKEQLKQKLAKVEDLVIFITVTEDSVCSECKEAIPMGDYLFLEQKQPLCRSCADMDHLVFLPAGDVAMTRRAKKHSPLSVVVTQFNRRRKRYDRQGLLVTAAALAQAEDECIADAGERAAHRQKAATYRTVVDAKFVDKMTAEIARLFPKCPPEEARSISQHAAERGSGRVGRSAAGQQLDENATTLAVIAHIRHIHTAYDTLLMQGTERATAREIIHSTVNKVLHLWRGN